MSNKTDGNDLIFLASNGTSCSGLTKREYFAAMALQGMLANCNTKGMYSAHDYLIAAVNASDGLINELNKEKK